MVSARSAKNWGRWSLTPLAHSWTIFATGQPPANLWPTFGRAEGRHALGLALQGFAVLGRRDAGIDRYLLRADGLPCSGHIHNDRARGQLVRGQFPALPHAPRGLIADAVLLGISRKLHVLRGAQHRTFVTYPTMFDSESL